MKIGHVNTLSISENAHSDIKLNEMPVGASVKARITAKTGSNEALLNIRGKEIKAFFQHGVPAYNFLSLVLDKKYGGRLFFSMKQEPADSLLFEALKHFLVLSKSGADIASLQKHMSSAGTSLFELNRLVAGIKHFPGMKLVAAFESIAFKYGSPQWLYALSLRITDALQPELTWLIRNIADNIGGGEHQKRRNQQQDEEDKKSIAELVEEASEGLTDKNDFEALVGGLLELAESKGSVLELPFWDGEKYMAFRCLKGAVGWIFRADFSGIGAVEILARNLDGAMSMDIYSSLETAEKLRTQNFGAANITVSCHSFNFLSEKILAFNSELAYSRTFDTKA